jgi:FtsH-binding integral membrane protein
MHKSKKTFGNLNFGVVSVYLSFTKRSFSSDTSPVKVPVFGLLDFFVVLVFDGLYSGISISTSFSSSGVLVFAAFYFLGVLVFDGFCFSGGLVLA